MTTLSISPTMKPHHSDEATPAQSDIDFSSQEKGQGPTPASCDECPSNKLSVYKGLGWLDRLLALWILLAIIIGILIGNFVDGAGDALQRGKFVQVSAPIGTLPEVVIG